MFLFKLVCTGETFGILQRDVSIMNDCAQCIG